MKRRILYWTFAALLVVTSAGVVLILGSRSFLGVAANPETPSRPADSKSAGPSDRGESIDVDDPVRPLRPIHRLPAAPPNPEAVALAEEFIQSLESVLETDTQRLEVLFSSGDSAIDGYLKGVQLQLFLKRMAADARTIKHHSDIMDQTASSLRSNYEKRRSHVVRCVQQVEQDQEGLLDSRIKMLERPNRETTSQGTSGLEIERLEARIRCYGELLDLVRDHNDKLLGFFHTATRCTERPDLQALTEGSLGSVEACDEATRAIGAPRDILGGLALKLLEDYRFFLQKIQTWQGKGADAGLRLYKENERRSSGAKGEKSAPNGTGGPAGPQAKGKGGKR